MKRCAKCNRTYPDDNQKFCTFDGGLLAADQPFDPNVTVQGLSAPPTAEKPTTRDLPDPNATVASSRTAPTEVFHKETGPTGGATVFEPRPTPPPQKPSAPLPQASQSAPLPVTSPATSSAAAPAKKSKLPMILGILALLLVLGVGAVVAAFFLVIKPRMDQTQPERSTVVVTNENENTATNENVNTAEAPETTDEFVPPAGAVKFTNSQANLDGRLAEHYVDFSFYYPGTWQVDPRAGVAGASNFAKVERRLPPDFTQENFAVGWYTSKGTFAADESTFPQLVEILGSSLAKGFPEYQKVSEGPTKVNSLDGYEFRFVSVSKGTEKGDIQLWGRVVFLPTGVSGDQTGATLIMLATSLAPELSGVADVGEKGEMPVILESFRFGRNR